MSVAVDGYSVRRREDGRWEVVNPDGVSYRVRLSPVTRCSCPGFHYRGKCKHISICKGCEVTGNDVMTIPGPNDLAEAPERAAIAIPATGGIARLAAALGKAQAACKPVQHDAHNQHQNYDYTSSEAIIGEGKQALASAGLALLPVRQSLNGWERNGEDRFELERHFLLLHSSGETLPLCVHWPVCPGKGRPLDKATAAAATLSLSYLLRDLLLMPRVDPADEVAARDDTPKPAAKQSKGDETIATEQVSEIEDLCRKAQAKWNPLRDWLRTKFADISPDAQTADLTVKQARFLKEKLLNKIAMQQTPEAPKQ